MNHAAKAMIHASHNAQTHTDSLGTDAEMLLERKKMHALKSNGAGSEG